MKPQVTGLGLFVVQGRAAAQYRTADTLPDGCRIVGFVGTLAAGLWCAPLVDEVAELVAAGDAELGIGAVQV